MQSRTNTILSTESHTYHLEPYKGKATRHKCPQCGDEHSFTLYVDADGNPLGAAVGRCNHESGCGYHYTPSQYFTDNPTAREIGGVGMARHQTESKRRPYFSKRLTPPTPPMEGKPTICTIPFSYVEKSASYKSTFIQFLCRLFDTETIGRLVEMYAIGATRAMDVVFWQIDSTGNVRGGKIIKYNPETGHRIKGGGGVDWVHARMKKQHILPDDWSLSQCMFGEHLLGFHGAFGINEQSIIAIVESEKSAIIGAGVFPQYAWMATGGIGNLNAERFEKMKGRTIIIFPDVDGTDKWRERARAITGCKVIVSDVLERHATTEERESKIDIADWLISHLTNGGKQPERALMSESHTDTHHETETPPQPPIWGEEGIPHMIHQPIHGEEDLLREMLGAHPFIADAIRELELIVTAISHIEMDGDVIVNNNEKQENNKGINNKNN